MRLNKIEREIKPTKQGQKEFAPDLIYVIIKLSILGSFNHLPKEMLKRGVVNAPKNLAEPLLRKSMTYSTFCKKNYDNHQVIFKEIY